MKTLVLYSSDLGQTRKIAQHIISQAAGEQEAEFVELNCPDSWPNPGDYDNVLIGASIHFGKFKPEVYRYIETYQNELGSGKCAFFMVCLTARKPEKCDPDINLYMKKFRKLSVWQPKLEAIFAGELAYSRYNWWQKRIIQLIMTITGGSTDTSADIEFTDWKKVDEFAAQFHNL